MANLELKKIQKLFNNLEILKNIDLSINSGEFLVLVGPSGSGKSTILRLISGLELPSSGNIYINNKDVTSLLPKNRDVAMVFQNYALYPHLSVFDNLAFPLKIKHINSSIINSKVNQISQMLGIEKLLKKKPKELSGGERQRVAVGRAIIRNPKLLLMDEPLSNLDAKLRSQMRLELMNLHKELKNTIVYVTHDQIEALTMGDRIVVLNHGIIQQAGTPDEVYNYPANVFVAGFLGSPGMNFFSFTVFDRDNFQIHDKKIKSFIPVDMFNKLLNLNLIGKEIILGIRPEDFILVDEEEQAILPLFYDIAEVVGNEYVISLNIKSYFASGKSFAKLYNFNKSKIGERAFLTFQFSSCHFFYPDSYSRILV